MIGHQEEAAYFEEVDILEEEVNLESSPEVEAIWPEDYETYISGGMYASDKLEN